MESVHNLEKTVAGWYKDVPHLPKGAQKWLAENAWWLVAIGALLAALSLLALIPLVLFAFGLSTAFGGVAAMGGYNYTVGAFAWLSVLVSLVTLGFYAVLSGMAITPLKAHKKRGWDLLFLIFIIEVASSVLTLVVSFNIGSLIGGLISAAIGAYFLFEIRGYFGVKVNEKAETKTAEKKPEAKKA
jgi:uncharacterized membrane protein HdeD (DUF308 family)